MSTTATGAARTDVGGGANTSNAPTPNSHARVVVTKYAAGWFTEVSHTESMRLASVMAPMPASRIARFAISRRPAMRNRISSSGVKM